jgi:hypothetical protein
MFGIIHNQIKKTEQQFHVKEWNLLYSQFWGGVSYELVDHKQ